MSNLALDYAQEERLSIKAEAAAGSFRAIALWLNEYLVPQQIFAQVSAASQPACLQVVVEFYRLPHRDRLVRFLCHRLWQLNSELIEGVHIMARTVGQTRPQWHEKIRIATPASRRAKVAIAKTQPLRSRPIPPQINAQAKAQVKPAPSPNTAVLHRHIKVVRTLLLSGSAVAAFLFGCFAEVMVSRPGPALPIISQILPDTDPAVSNPAVESNSPADNDFQLDGEAIAVSYDPEANVQLSQPQNTLVPAEPAEPQRPKHIQAPLEPVAVIPHQHVMYPGDANVTLLFSGEIDLDTLPYDAVEADRNILGALADYQQVDIAMISLGDPLAAASTQPREELYGYQRPDAIDILKDAGIDMVNLSSDNLLTLGDYGLEETLDVVDRAGLYRVGAGRDAQEARRPEIIEVKGQRIAYLSYNQSDVNRAYSSSGGVNVQDKRRVIEDIRTLRNQVDWIVVNYRWQEDVPDTPADWQTNLARLAIDQGADVVVGYHPTQMQGGEIYKGRPIAYSLGDFVFGDMGRDRETAMLKISVRPDQMKVDLLPVVIANNQPQLATGDAADAIFQKIQAASIEFHQPLQASEVITIRPRHRLQPQSLPQQPSDRQPEHSSPSEITPFTAPLIDGANPAPNRIPNQSPNQAEEAQPNEQPRVSPTDETTQPAPSAQPSAQPTIDAQTAEPDSESAPTQITPTQESIPTNSNSVAPPTAVPKLETSPTPPGASQPVESLIPDPSVPRIDQPATVPNQGTEALPFEQDLERQLKNQPPVLLPEWGPEINSTPETNKTLQPAPLPLPETLPGLVLEEPDTADSASSLNQETAPQKSEEKPEALAPYPEPLVGPLSDASSVAR